MLKSILFPVENLTKLESLSFERNHLTTEILSSIKDFAKQNPNIRSRLKKLVLKRNLLEKKTSKRLLEIQKIFRNLEHVDLSDNALDQKEIQMLCNVIHFAPSLVFLDIRGNPGETKRVSRAVTAAEKGGVQVSGKEQADAQKGSRAPGGARGGARQSNQVAPKSTAQDPVEGTTRLQKADRRRARGGLQNEPDFERASVEVRREPPLLQSEAFLRRRRQAGGRQPAEQPLVR